MGELRFDGRVAVVTGGGRGLGKAQATELAARGARVVVNDLGVSVEGHDPDPHVAEDAARAIRDAGGDAVAHAGDVGLAEDAEALVALAIEQYGRLDIVIANAAIWVGRPDLRDFDTETVVRAAHADPVGSLNVCRSAWPHFIEQAYGRIVLSSSSSFLGGFKSFGYSISKGGTMSLGRTLSQAGAEHGIKSNIVAPFGYSRMVEINPKFDAAGLARREQLGPADGPSAAVLVLAHESCPVTGEFYACGAGQVQRFFIGVTPGVGQRELTPEELLERWAEVDDTSGWEMQRGGSWDFSGPFYERRERLVFGVENNVEGEAS